MLKWLLYMFFKPIIQFLQQPPPPQQASGFWAGAASPLPAVPQPPQSVLTISQQTHFRTRKVHSPEPQGQSQVYNSVSGAWPPQHFPASPPSSRVHLNLNLHTQFFPLFVLQSHVQSRTFPSAWPGHGALQTQSQSPPSFRLQTHLHWITSGKEQNSTKNK